MFHIIFNADQNYMKYVAVLITNIIHYTDTSKRFADFLEAQDSDDELINGGGGSSITSISLQILCRAAL